MRRVGVRCRGLSGGRIDVVEGAALGREGSCERGRWVGHANDECRVVNLPRFQV